MNTEQERAAFEAACRKHAEESGYDGHERLERNGDGYADPHTQAAWWGWREGLAALQSQDEDIFSPTSLTGLSKDELIRQLQWALNYWMPNIADDGTPDGERAAREAYLLLGIQAPVGREEENTPTYWERVSNLQSRDREDVKRPVLDSIVDEIHRRADKEWADDGYDFEVTITADEYKALCEEEKAIDRARRAEGE